MARYRVLAKSYIAGAIREVGETVDYDGRASWNLEPLDPEEHAEWLETRANPDRVEEALRADRRGFDPAELKGR